MSLIGINATKDNIYMYTGSSWLVLGRISFLVDRRMKSTENTVRIFRLRDEVLSRILLALDTNGCADV